MAVTSTGVSYTPRTWTNAVGDQCIWAVADRLRYTEWRKPALLYCHGNGGGYNYFTNSSGYTRFRDLLIDNGWVYIETLGRDASHWGREFAMESYALAAKEAATRHPLGTLVLHGRSMGGTVSSSLAVKPEYGLSQHVVGLLLESAVQDMYDRHVVRGYSLNGQYPEGRPSQSGNPSAFAAAVAPFNPIQFDTALYANMPVQFIHGDADDNVTPGPNPEAQLARIQSVAPYSNLVLRPGGTHGVSESGDLAFVTPAWEFVRRAQNLFPVPIVGRIAGTGTTARGALYGGAWITAEPLTGDGPIEEPEEPDEPEEPPYEGWDYEKLTANYGDYEEIPTAFADYEALAEGPLPDSGPEPEPEPEPDEE